MYAPATRARRRSGISAVLMEPPTMSRIITPKPERNSAAKSRASTSQNGPWASGTSTSGAGKSPAVEHKGGPAPHRGVEAPGRDGADQPPDRRGTEDDPQHRRPDAQ